jgi:hypothetical protein
MSSYPDSINEIRFKKDFDELSLSMIAEKGRNSMKNLPPMDLKNIKNPLLKKIKLKLIKKDCNNC